MKKIFLFVFLLIFALTFSNTAFAANFTGDIAQTIDPNATNGSYYLRHTGNPAPAGYAHTYQWANPRLVCDPNNTPVIFTGSIDVSDMLVNDVVMLGLIDQSLLANGYHGWGSGAYVYIHKKTENTMRIGASDGFDFGELVQSFGIYPISEDGIMDIELTIHNGEITVSVDGNADIVDTYGDIKAGNNLVSGGYYDEEEFHSGAIVGWDAFPLETMPYSFKVKGCSPSATGIAGHTSNGHNHPK